MSEEVVTDQRADEYADDLPEQVRVRREKYDRLVAGGAAPYPLGYPRTATLAEVRERFADIEPDSATGQTVSVAGRVVLYRTGGKLCFATIQQGSGPDIAQLQVMVSLDGVGADRLAAWKSDVDLGDHIGVTGEVISSRRGELSILAGDWQLTSKALRPLPDKHKGLTDPEARVRQRYVDLVVNPSSRQMVYDRATVVRTVRDVLHGHGFVEVETPSLQLVHGGAAARPFHTHLNALDVDVTLRIALELYLKRLVVGGIDRVFEIGKNFRNEGIDATHFPEFSMLEFYEAYGDYDTVADETRELVLAAAHAIGRTTVPDGSGGEIDLEKPWRSATVHGLVSEAVGETIDPGTTIERVTELAAAHDVALQPGWDAGEIVLELYEKLVEHTLLEPTFVRDYPVSARPLARNHRDDPRLAEAWDLVVGGTELATGYSELVDPVEQRRRLLEQSLKAAGGDPEAMQLDEDFLRALEHGMPPTGGQGMGIDRLVMLLTGAPIRETILFPLVRPEQ
ncbi:MAG: lysyl-tRNA synthetase, class-2 [Frankiales bacterium]|nr:lysyl-tRNA synthetase, class-2 [Frankiales bacterium]